MKRNIPGIYNYCDRWCKRCNYKNRCAVYADSVNDTMEEKDISNQAYWNKISKNLKKGLKILHKAAEKYGVDLDNIPREEEEQIVKEQNEIRQLVMEHRLIKNCDRYSKLTYGLMHDEEFWQQKGNDLIAEINCNLVDEENGNAQLALISNCRETIQWYKDFIGIKFRRALSGKIEFTDLHDPVQNDSNGSARVAMICLERTKKAWKRLFELIPDEDQILPVLALLSQIERIAHEEFPQAGQFQRPGFDD